VICQQLSCHAYLVLNRLTREALDGDVSSFAKT
jgi:hypothetical protein